MQTGKKAVESVKETAANAAASAKSGMEKTKATLQEKGEKLTAHSDADKLMAEQRKERRSAAADLNKEEAKAENAAQRNYATATEPHKMSSALPGHGTGLNTRLGTGPHSGATGPGTGGAYTG